MITPSFGLTATERVLPNLALDFTTATLDPRVTFTRTTGASNPATYTNSSGYVANATNNQARFDYDPITFVCKGLLIEESRANNLIYSSDANNSAWVKTNVTLGTGATSPDGASASNELIATTTSSQHSYRQTQTVTAGANTFSIFAKNNGQRYFSLYPQSGGTAYAIFDLQTATVTKTGGANYVASAIQNYGNGWYRCSVTVTSTAAPLSCFLYLTNSDTVPSTTFAGNGTDGLYVWGAQLETGAFATSYIPTTTTALTRNADVATMTGSNFSSWYNASEGTFTGLFENTTYGANALLSCSDGTTANYFQFAEASQNSPRYLVVSSSVIQANISVPSSATTFNCAFTYKTNSFNAAVKSVLGTKDTSGTVPSVSRLDIGFVRQTGGYSNGTIQKINYYPLQLTDAELQAFSK